MKITLKAKFGKQEYWTNDRPGCRREKNAKKSSCTISIGHSTIIIEA
jgi:hypothetical protein